MKITVKQRIILVIMIISYSIGSFPQIEGNDPLKIDKYKTENGEKFIFKSKILNENREIYIGLPDDFNDSTAYPVIMVLEGEVVFETFAPLTRLMAQVNEIPPCIVVGIPFYERHLDYAPKISGQPESGNADKMLDFYRFELFPLIESLYHCTDDRLIWAHSALGAIFCTYILLGPDTQFTGIISSSPNLKWMQDYVKKDNAFEEVEKKGKIFYYLTFGGNEGEDYMGEMFQNVRDFKIRLENEAPGNLIWKYQLNENDNHFTNAIETYTDGLILYFQIMK